MIFQCSPVGDWTIEGDITGARQASSTVYHSISFPSVHLEKGDVNERQAYIPKHHAGAEDGGKAANS